MNTRKIVQYVPLLLFCNCLAQAQDAGLAVIYKWLTQQVNAANADKATQAKTVAAKKKPSQTQSISIDHGSTTFVDQSSGADLVSSVLNLAPVGGNQNGSGTVSASLYSLYALGTHSDPLLPTFYNDHEKWRTVFVTVGREDQNQNPQNQSTQSPLGTVYGIKWLPVNRRDATSITRDPIAKEAFNNIAREFAGNVSSGASAIAQILSDHNGVTSGESQFKYLQTLTSVAIVQAEIDKLSPAERDRIDLIVKRYSVDDAAVDKNLNIILDRLRHRFQMSLAFQTIQRAAGLNDDYRIDLIFDRGLFKGLFLTLNASYDYSNSQKLGGDVRDGRAAFDLRWTLADPPGHSLKSPLQLALSGEGLRKETQWQYRAQLQLQIPIATGVNLPISFGYGNRADVLRQQEKDVYGKFGVSFDMGKIIDALRGSK